MLCHFLVGNQLKVSNRFAIYRNTLEGIDNINTIRISIKYRNTRINVLIYNQSFQFNVNIVIFRSNDSYVSKKESFSKSKGKSSLITKTYIFLSSGNVYNCLIIDGITPRQVLL